MQVRLPSNIEAEQQILGALLTRDELYFDVVGEITADDFFDRGHGAVFRTVEQLVQGGKRVNVTLVRDYIFASDTRTKIDHAYLEQLMDAVADLSDAVHYARQVSDLARRRRMINAMVDGVSKIGKLDPLVSSQAVIDDVETEILNASRADQTTMRRLGDWATIASTRAIEAVERPSPSTRGIKWRLTAVDNVIGPVLAGRLIILGGRPGSGKSALAGQAAEAFGEQAPGYIQSLEMEGEEWAERAMAQHADIAAWRINVAELNEADLEALIEAARRLRTLPVWIDQKPRLTIEQIRARAIRYRHLHDIRWMIVDHLHIIRPSTKRADKFESVDEACYELKQLAKDLKIGVVALAQMNKEVRQRAGGRPRAGDLLFYSAIEPHADAIVFTHRPEISLGEEKPECKGPDDKIFNEWKSRFDLALGKAEIINAKRRGGKSYQTQECRFIGPTMKFEDLQQTPTLLADDEFRGW